MKSAKYTKDTGITRQSILKLLTRPRTIPELKAHISSQRLQKDVTIRTAIKNMIAEKVIEVVDEPRNCYQAARYQKIQYCTYCGYPAPCREIYSDADCTNLDLLVCDQCYEMVIEGWL